MARHDKDDEKVIIDLTREGREEEIENRGDSERDGSPKFPAAAAAAAAATGSTIDLTCDASLIDLVSHDERNDDTKPKAVSHTENRKRKRQLKSKTDPEFHDGNQLPEPLFPTRKPPPQAAVAPAIALFDCPICLESVERFRGFSLSHCAHTFCRQCLHGYIQTKLSEKAVGPRQLTCPHSACADEKKKPAEESSERQKQQVARLSPSDVRACTLELGDSASWRTYQELATETFLDSAANAADAPFRRCPSERCNFTFQYDGHGDDDPAQGQLFICPECQQAYCLNCPVVRSSSSSGSAGAVVGPAHDDTCAAVLEEVRRSRERQVKLEQWKRENAAADARFQELIQKEGTSGTTKPCPSCGMAITKNGGCSHMYCVSCSTHFNW